MIETYLCVSFRSSPEDTRVTTTFASSGPGPRVIPSWVIHTGTSNIFPFLILSLIFPQHGPSNGAGTDQGEAAAVVTAHTAPARVGGRKNRLAAPRSARVAAR